MIKIFNGECVQSSDDNPWTSWASFAEWLDITFKTSAKIDLHCDFEMHLQVEAPPIYAKVPALNEIKFDKMASQPVSQFCWL